MKKTFMFGYSIGNPAYLIIAENFEKACDILITKAPETGNDMQLINMGCLEDMAESHTNGKFYKVENPYR
jgi:hypothetical protein